jgi:hypothetical protein
MHAIEATSYATKSMSCPLSTGSDDFLLRFEASVMAKLKNDGWALAVGAATAGGTPSAAMAATRSGSFAAGISTTSGGNAGAGLTEPNCAWRCTEQAKRDHRRNAGSAGGGGTAERGIGAGRSQSERMFDCDSRLAESGVGIG